MELNVGGIVAAVLVTLILLGLLIGGIWYAYSRGYFDSKCPPLKAILCIATGPAIGSWVLSTDSGTLSLGVGVFP